MTSINLLPWRENLRKKKTKDFMLILAVFVFTTFILVIAIHFSIKIDINQQINRNEIIKNHINMENKKIIEINFVNDQKEKIFEKLNVIEKIKSNNLKLSKFLYDVAVNIPNDTYLTEIKIINNEISVSGFSKSNTDISKFIDSLFSEKSLSSLEINLMENIDNMAGGQLNKFTFQAKF